MIVPFPEGHPSLMTRATSESESMKGESYVHCKTNKLVPHYRVYPYSYVFVLGFLSRFMALHRCSM